MTLSSSVCCVSAPAIVDCPSCISKKVFNGARESDEADPQKSLHVDTFQPTMKFWLYLEEVGERNGPFMFVPQSTQLNRGDWIGSIT